MINWFKKQEQNNEEVTKRVVPEKVKKVTVTANVGMSQYPHTQFYCDLQDDHIQTLRELTVYMTKTFFIVSSNRAIPYHKVDSFDIKVEEVSSKEWIKYG